MRVIVDEPRLVTTSGAVVETGKRVVSPIERMARRGEITPRQEQAAKRIYTSWAIGIQGASAGTAHGCTAWSPSGYSDAVLAAATDYRLAIQALGKRMSPVVLIVVLGEETVERAAAELHQRREGAAAILRTSLDILADHWGIPE